MMMVFTSEIAARELMNMAVTMPGKMSRSVSGRELNMRGSSIRSSLGKMADMAR